MELVTDAVQLNIFYDKPYFAKIHCVIHFALVEKEI